MLSARLSLLCLKSCAFGEGPPLVRASSGHVPGVPSSPKRMVHVRGLSRHLKLCQFAIIKQQDPSEWFAVAVGQPDAWSADQAQLPAHCLALKTVLKKIKSPVMLKELVGDGEMMPM